MVYEARRDRKAAADCYRKVIEFVKAHPKQYEPTFTVTFEQMIHELDPPRLRRPDPCLYNAPPRSRSMRADHRLPSPNVLRTAEDPVRQRAHAHQTVMRWSARGWRTVPCSIAAPRSMLSQCRPTHAAKVARKPPAERIAAYQRVSPQYTISKVDLGSGALTA
jgi:hypothetical protein